MIDDDPTRTDPELYRTVWENEHVRVLEYLDEPGSQTNPHDHPNSVMVTLSPVERRLRSGDRTFEVSLPPERAVWLPAQRHAGENIGDAPIHVLLIELKGAAAGDPSATVLGPGPAATSS